MKEAAMVAVCLMAGTAFLANAQPATGDVASLEFCVNIDRGADVGQDFGTLFETQSANGAFVLGAGFQGAFNTRYRGDRHVVHFFVRPTSGEREESVAQLPRPNDKAGTYLCSRDGTLYAAEPEVRVWRDEEAGWDTGNAGERFRMRLGNGTLGLEDGRVVFNEDTVIAKPPEGAYTGYYYAYGHVILYHTFWSDTRGYRSYADDASGYTRILACPWRPEDGTPADMTKAVVLTLPVVGEFPYAFGQLRGEVLSCSNIGGGYVFDGTAWRTVIDGSMKTSYQVYCMIGHRDRIIMGQYPTGELFEFDGEKVTRLEGWPPVMPGVSGSAREAQSIALYAGDLYVGVWPWGEVWRYDFDTKQWSLARRMFAHPKPTDATIHPYENECAALGGVANQWGQRVTSLVVHGSDLMISTSAKWPCDWEPKFDFVGDDKWKEYGTVTRLTVPGHVSAPVAWTDGPTELRFRVNGEGMTIAQDGKTIATTKLPKPLSTVAVSGVGDVTWKAGLYGAFSGAALEGEVVVAGDSM
ncbi:MAG: hypothetical protein GY851_23040 [bacterium]|nr:hypothetical protein [bacterium]